MPAPPKVATSIEALAAATDRLLASVDAIDDLAVLREPSLLPGWSRAHVLTHLARNADGFRNVLAAGRTGRDVPMYPSPEVRSADIEAGATRPLEVIVIDVRAAAERLAVDLETFPEDRWEEAAGRTLVGSPFTASVVPKARLCEVEAHHVDADLGYGFDRSPAEAIACFLDQVPTRWATAAVAPCTLHAVDLDRSWVVGDGDAAPVIEGTGGALLAWALGRAGGGDGLTSTAGEVPASPGWG